MSIVASKIRNARTSKNMTQMTLADTLGVSFQAVSNWERGNAMPDIGKLPDLCNILGISFEELVGEKSKVTENVQKVMNDQNTRVALDELADIAPIMNPNRIESVINQNCSEGEPLDLGALCGLAPFLTKDKLDKLAERVEEVELGALVGLAPFISQDTLGKLAERAVEVDLGVLCGLAPFLTKDKLDKLAERVEEVELGALTGLAHYLSQETLDRIAQIWLLKR